MAEASDKILVEELGSVQMWRYFVVTSSLTAVEGGKMAEAFARH